MRLDMKSTPRSLERDVPAGILFLGMMSMVAAVAYLFANDLTLRFTAVGVNFT